MAEKQGVITETDGDDQDIRGRQTDGENVQVDEKDDKGVKKDADLDVEIKVGEPPSGESDEDEHLDVSGGAQEAEEAEKRQHRETAKERRERAKRARDRDRNEIAYLRQQSDALAQELARMRGAQFQNQAQYLEQQADVARSEAAQFEAIRKSAAEAKNIEDALAAEKVRAAAEQRAQDLAKQAQQVRQASQQQPQRVVPPAVQANVNKFLSEHPWYNPNSDDPDVVAVKAIDRIVATQYDPATPEYWQELDKRAAKVIPHRYENDQDDDDGDAAPGRQRSDKTRKGPPVGGGGKGSAPSQSGKEIYLPPAYVESLKEAGLWDDPKTRAKMAKRYVESQKNRG